MSAPEYPVDTLAEMAAIPLEARDRFLAELPSMLDEVNRLRGVAEVFNKAFEGMVAMDPLKGAVWVDDDKGIATTTVTMTGTDDKIVVSRKMGDAA